MIISIIFIRQNAFLILEFIHCYMFHCLKFFLLVNFRYLVSLHEFSCAFWLVERGFLSATVLLIFGVAIQLMQVTNEIILTAAWWQEIVGKKSLTVVCFLFCLVPPRCDVFPFYVSNEIVFVKMNPILSIMFLPNIVIKYRRCKYLLYMLCFEYLFLISFFNKAVMIGTRFWIMFNYWLQTC